MFTADGGNNCDVLGKLLSHKEEKLEKEGTPRPFIPDGHERLTQMGWETTPLPSCPTAACRLPRWRTRNNVPCDQGVPSPKRPGTDHSGQLGSGVTVAVLTSANHGVEGTSLCSRAAPDY